MHCGHPSAFRLRPNCFSHSGPQKPACSRASIEEELFMYNRTYMPESKLKEGTCRRLTHRRSTG
jgi:hypothetical protein